MVSARFLLTFIDNYYLNHEKPVTEIKPCFDTIIYTKYIFVFFYVGNILL